MKKESANQVQEFDISKTYGTWSFYGTDYFTKLRPCKHEIIDNGSRVSECRHCKVKMRLKGFDWSAE